VSLPFTGRQLGIQIPGSGEFVTAVQNGWNSLPASDFVGDFGEVSLLSESGSPQRLGAHGEGYSFFVYREMPARRQAGIPIDENNLSS
jgi:hypothetical protein